MDMRWNLDALYESLESESFKKDYAKFEKDIDSIKKWISNNLSNTDEAVEKIENFILMINDFYNTYSRLAEYSHLLLSVDAKDQEAVFIDEKLEMKAAELTEIEVQFQKWLSNIQNIDVLANHSKIIKEHQFYINELIEKNSYTLSKEEELIIAKMKNTGSSSWLKLQMLLTSTLLVDININSEEKKLPLPIVRNMAYSSDALIRKTAYEAEQKSYKKIEESSCACLNGIKGEVLTLSKARGYKTTLEKTLKDSRMDNEMLNVLLDAMKDSLPSFHKYFRKKAALLGHKDGLPFYDIFAPIGELKTKFSYDEAKSFIVHNFYTFNKNLGDLASCAFEDKWIDAEPREGKRGGAFCCNIHSIGQSRILANFTGGFNDMTTLAHELGHAYHGHCLRNLSYLNSNYPMPLAETASIFSETIIKNAAIAKASKSEALTILENDISDSAQVIVDIYSRFLFESEVFKRRENSSLSVEEFKSIMINAQIEAYGDGLDKNFLHPYMWINKPHYYYSDANYYNFPYAFGLLFARGLYAKYLEIGNEFVQLYDTLLEATGKMNIADVAKTAKIDLYSKDFWKSSIKLIEQDIDKFISLC